MEPEKEHKLSKHKQRKAQCYGKKATELLRPDNRNQINANPDLVQFIRSLVKPRIEEDHSLDELEFEKRPRHILPGSFETGKRR